MQRKSYLVKEDGERFSLLVGQNGIPDFWTTLYLTTNLRSAKHATQKAALNHLIHINVWEMALGERISDRIIKFTYKSKISSKDTFFTDVEIQQLADHCKLKTKEARRRLLDQNSKKRDDTNLKAFFPSYKKPDPVVQNTQFCNRLENFAEYFEFIANNILRGRAAFSSYLDIIDNTKKAILKQKKKRGRVKNNTYDPNRKAPPPEVFEALMKIVEPSSTHNPYSKSVRLRNYVLIKILYETGLRAGEVLQLKVSDISFAHCELMVRVRHDDPEDKFRVDEPNAKTLERDIPISESLRDLIREYVLNERRFIANTQKHSFLFVSNKGLTKGNPLSSIQFSRIIEKVSVNDELAEFIKQNGIPVDKRITRHGFRHNFNNKISKLIDLNNKEAISEGREHDVISQKKEVEQRMYLNGHRSEKSAEIYNLRHTQEQAEKILKIELEIIDQDIKKGRDQ